MSQLPKPESASIGALVVPRLISGLWQLAGGHDDEVDVESAATFMLPLIKAGLNCFDMADHYGDAEIVIGTHNNSSDEEIVAFTKWCPPENGVKTLQQAEAAVDLALGRMKQKQIALMQYHIWDYTDDTYLHNLNHLRTLQQRGKIGQIGLTNTDAAHLELLIDSGYKIATNQVSCSVMDRRLTRGRLASVCDKHGVGILAYGTLLGGFLSEKWLGLAEPDGYEKLNWSLRKYLRFINAAGGWGAFQTVLKSLSQIAQKHDVSIAAVATRYVLDIPAVSAVIVGTRLTADSQKYIAGNLAAFTFSLDAEDNGLIAKAQEDLVDIPGDSGDEYRRAPFLTATGDLSQHIKKGEQELALAKAIDSGARIEYSSGSKWEPLAGYCRAVRTGSVIRISGTTANSPLPSIPVVGGRSARSQTVHVLDIIGRALKVLGGSLSDVVRTRIMVPDVDDVDEISKAHGWAFNCAGVRPANTLVVTNLVGPEFLVEIEAEAVLGFDKVVRI
ncbi:endoribonuclease L-PSP [Phlyctema vagabunda]|uniref:Endoribonuclease L-PSP n=1 Tax=Phlyctema vagabunda TaxID=108571 RepID=A0ABR4PG20_9HELO